MNLQEITEEPTQPTRFFRQLDTPSHPHLAPNRKESFKDIKISPQIQPQLPKIPDRRVSTEASIKESKAFTSTLIRDSYSRENRSRQYSQVQEVSSPQKLWGTINSQERNVHSKMSVYHNDHLQKFQFRPRKLINEKEVEQFTFNVRKLEELYELLSDVMMGVYSGNLKLIKDCLLKYITYMNEKRYEFIDSFIEQLSPKGQRIITVSRIHEYMCVLYIAERIVQKELKKREDTLVNCAGFCAGNAIFIAKLYLMSRKTEETLPFEEAIREYEKVNFGGVLEEYRDIVTRIQHNNETIKITEVRQGKHDFELHNKLKDFFKLATLDKYTPTQSFYYLFEYFAFYLHLHTQLGFLECLQTSPAPYLPFQKYRLTVVLEPVGVFVCQKRLKIGIRPNTHEFLSYLSKRNCEIIFWTESMPNTLKEVLRMVDPQKLVSEKLYRYHCSKYEGRYIKDLSRLGRDLDKTLVIDYSKDAFILNLENGIESPWNKSIRDNSLVDLMQILSFILKNESPIEVALKDHEDQIKRLKAKSKVKL